MYDLVSLHFRGLVMTLRIDSCVPISEHFNLTHVSAGLDDAGRDVAGEVSGGLSGSTLGHDDEFVEGHASN